MAENGVKISDNPTLASADYLLALNEHLLHTEKMLQRASRAKQRIA